MIYIQKVIPCEFSKKKKSSSLFNFTKFCIIVCSNFSPIHLLPFELFLPSFIKMLISLRNWWKLSLLVLSRYALYSLLNDIRTWLHNWTNVKVKPYFFVKINVNYFEKGYVLQLSPIFVCIIIIWTLFKKHIEFQLGMASTSWVNTCSPYACMYSAISHY